MPPSPFGRSANMLTTGQMRQLGVGPPQPSRMPARISPQQCGSELPLAPGQPGQQTSKGWCDATRVLLAGGAMNQLMLDPSFTPFEQLFRALPEEGMFNPALNPDAPFSFTIGSFRPEQGYALALFDLRPDVYRFSGIDAGDAVPAEARRYATALGFDVTVDYRRPYARMEFQLDPVAIDHSGATSFRPTQGATDLFSGVNINDAATAAPSGAGASLQPQRPHRPGSLTIPFMLLARSGETVTVRVIVFHPIQSPIAFIEYSFSGIMFPEKVLDAYLRCMVPKADIPR